MGIKSVSEKYLIVFIIAAVCFIVIAVYWPVLSAQAICFDDYAYFFDNPLVRNPGWESAQRFLTEVLNPTIVLGYYQPLAMISLMLDYALVGPTDDISQFHRTSLTLHAANTALIIVFLYLLFGRIWIAAGAGLLFGLHPMTVESIAWLGERKTVLAAFFAIWSLIFYMHYARAGKWKFFLWTVLMYVLALMSKPTSTPLPAMMLLMDYWPLKRLKWGAVWEKIPLFIIGGISAGITYISQSRSAGIILPEGYGGLARIPLVISHNIIAYLLKIVLPLNLTAHTPFPVPFDLSQPMVMAGVIGTIALVFLIFISLYKTRGLLTGFLIFLVMILPTMQVLQFSNVILSYKFAYLPSLGLLMTLSGFLCWISRYKRKAIGFVMGSVIVLLASGEAVATWNYLACWRDSISLWGHMSKVTPSAVIPRRNFGISLAQAGDLDGAMKQFKIILKTDPNDGDTYYNIGKIFADRKENVEAKQYYEKALQLEPKKPHIYDAFGILLFQEGKLEESAQMYRNAIANDAQMPSLMHAGLGSVLMYMGLIDEAIVELETAVQMKADSKAYCNLGKAKELKGDTQKAAEYYKKAIMMDPNNAEAHYNLGTGLLSQGDLAEAMGEFEKAIKAKPNYAKAYGNMAIVLTQTGRRDEAVENFRLAVEFDPNSPDAHFNLANALADKGLNDEAIAHMRRVVELSPADIAARVALAGLLLQQGKVEQAAIEYEEVLRIEPNNQDALVGLKKAKEVRPAN